LGGGSALPKAWLIIRGARQQEGPHAGDRSSDHGFPRTKNDLPPLLAAGV
jgi:hypothetical protein